MKAKKIVLIFVLLILALPLLGRTAIDWETLEVDGQIRRYHLVKPTPLGKKVPVVIVFHGGGSNARRAVGMGFSKLAQRGYLVVYPEALNGRWQVGFPDDPKYDSTIDETKFVSQMLDKIESDLDVSLSSVFCTGPSNGGMISHQIGAELSERVSAVAPIIGGMAKNVADNFAPTSPVSVLVIQGTEDPLVPYHGGALSVRGKTFGEVLATEEVVKLWSNHNRTTREETEALADSVNDNCETFRSRWSEGTDGSEVVLYKVVGGGHTLPGGTQYLPEKIIGRLTHDFRAVDVVADFFDRHRR